MKKVLFVALFSCVISGLFLKVINSREINEVEENEVEEIAEFDFNRDIAIKYAIVTLEEIDAVAKVKRFSENIQDEPIVNAIISYDKEKENSKKIVVVSFRSKKGNYYHSVTLILNKDGFLEIFDRTESSLDDLIKDLKTPGAYSIWENY